MKGIGLAVMNIWVKFGSRIESELPHLSAYLQSGGLVDAVLNLGLSAPIDIQVSGSSLEKSYKTAHSNCVQNPFSARCQ